MAHNLSIVGGRAEMFVAGDPAWHSLGVNVKSAKTWEQAIDLAHLNWLIHKEQLQDVRGKSVNSYGLFRSDNNVFIAGCGSKYTVIQNKDAFTFVDALVESEKGCHYISAGALGRGETIWCLAEVPYTMRIKGTDDQIKTYLLFTDNRDHQAAKTKLSTVRVVCQNTYNQAMHDGEKIFSLRHTTGVIDKMKRAKDILINVRGQMKSLEEKFNILAQKKATNKVMQDVMNRLFPKLNESERTKNQVRDILTRYELNDNNAFPSERGTAWNLLNAVTGYIDHEKSVRVGNFMVDAPEGVSLDVSRDRLEYTKRAESAMFGTGDVFKGQALQYILEAVETVPSMNSKVDAIIRQMAV